MTDKKQTTTKKTTTKTDKEPGVSNRVKKYRPSICAELPDMFLNGEAVEEVCVKLGITKRTFYQWIEKYPDFADAYEVGRQNSQAWWLKLGREGATGQANVHPTIWIFNMKNRLGWRDKIEVDGDKEKAEPLNISFNVNDAKGEVKITRGTDAE